MRFFASREATTIAEPPEPSRFSGAKSLKLKAESLKQIQTLWQAGRRRRGISVYSVCSVDSKMLIFRAFRAFRGSNSMFWLRLDRSRSIRIHWWFFFFWWFLTEAVGGHDDVVVLLNVTIAHPVQKRPAAYRIKR